MMFLAVLLVAWTTNDSMRSKEVPVMRGSDTVVRFKARIEENYLIITATHKKGWHTYAMDNELRALTALQGKPSLGIEKGIDIQVERGLELDGSWHQTMPRDFSKPELRWYSYGFERTAFFACRVKEISSDEVILRLRGQACSDETCCEFNTKLSLQAADPLSDAETKAQAAREKMTLGDLVPVETRDDQRIKQQRSPAATP